MPGRSPVGEGYTTLAGTTETIDLTKSNRVFVGTVTAACVLTLSNAPMGFTRLKFYLTNPHTNFDILNCLWVGGTLAFTQTGIDYLEIGIIRTADATSIFEIKKSLALATDT